MESDIEVLISAEQINQRVDEIAREIAETYRGQHLTIVGVLNGCLVFLADLIRRLDIPLRFTLIKACSYRGTATSPGKLEIDSGMLPDLEGRHVLLLDDILDTGQTIRYLVQFLQEKKSASVRVAVLLRKRGRQQVDLEPDFCCFEIPDRFVVGYGLDFNDEYRQLPYLGVLRAMEAGPSLPD